MLQQRVLLYRHTASGVKAETVLVAEETLWTNNINFVQDVETCSSWHLIRSVFYDICKIKFSRYRPGVIQRVGRGIAVLFHDLDTRRG